MYDFFFNNVYKLSKKLLQSKIHPSQSKRSERVPFVQITIHANARQFGDASFSFLALYYCHYLSKKTTADSVGNVLNSFQ